VQITLDHAHLFASDLAATLSFFRRMFAAETVWDQEVAGVRGVRLRIGHAFIHVYDQAPKAPRGGAVHHLGIETDDLDALVAHMRAEGIAFRNPVRRDTDFRYVMVAGPDDLLIELFECARPQQWRLARGSAAGAP